METRVAIMERKLSQGNKGGIKSRERRKVRREQTRYYEEEESWNKKEDNKKLEKERISGNITGDKQEQEMWKSDKNYTTRKNDNGWWDGLDRQSRKKMRDREREEERQ